METPEKTNIAAFNRSKLLTVICFAGLVSFTACTAITASGPTDAEVFATTNKANQVQLKTDSTSSDAVDVEQMVPTRLKDPCTAINAQEAWLALDNKKPKLGSLFSSEIYFSSQGTKMLAVSQQSREVYGEEQGQKSYIEISAELAERGSRVGSFSQVIATRSAFAEPSDLFASLPPYWQQQVQDPQAVLSIKHYRLKDSPGFVKFENDIVSDLSTKLEQGVELRCRSGEPCLCL
jgi:hypothetical protein